MELIASQKDYDPNWITNYIEKDQKVGSWIERRLKTVPFASLFDGLEGCDADQHILLYQCSQNWVPENFPFEFVIVVSDDFVTLTHDAFIYDLHQGHY